MDGVKSSNKSKNAKSISEEDSKGLDSGEGQEKNGKDTAQIRSRITVVCKECKRLKLKCDRKMPCASCVKRGTVHNCEYSQQATEKVDLQSLNNRIMDLEMALLRVTQGLPPNYLPTYPPVQTRAVDEGVWPGENQVGVTSSSSLLDPVHSDHDGPLTSGLASSIAQLPQHGHHHHLAAPRIVDATPAGEQVANRAFRRLLGLSSEPVDTEPVDPLKREHDASDSVDIIMGSSSSRKVKGGAPHDPVGSVRKQQQHLAQISLPPRKAYYPLEASDKQLSVSRSSVSATWNGAEPPRPSITSNLCRVLPPPTVCATLIAAAREVFDSRPTEFGLPLMRGGKPQWSRFESRCRRVYEKAASSTGVPAPKSKGKSSKLSLGDLVTGSGADGGAEPSLGSFRETLPFFALMCAVMAVGASRRHEIDEGTATPAFFLALSQQAQEVFIENGQKELGVSAEADEMIRDERVEYIRASIVQLSCLLEMAVTPLSTLSSHQNTEKEASLRIIGRMVTALQMWGHEPGFCAASDGTMDAITSELQSARRRTWWDALHYDSTLPWVFGKTNLAPSTLYAVPLPDLESDTTPLRSSHKDRDAADEMGQQRLERLLISVRASLTRLVHSVSSRMSSQGCCCGYPLDQAIILWGEVQRWMNNVPPEFADAFQLKSSSKLFGLRKDFDIAEGGSRASSQPSVGEADGSSEWWNQMMSCELALVAFSLVTRIFAPFAALALDQDAKQDVSNDFHVPLGHYISASESTIRVSRVIKRCLELRPPSSPKPTSMVVHSLDNLIINATIACSLITTSFAEKIGIPDRSGRDTLELMHSIRLGLDLLEDSRNKTSLSAETRQDLQKLRERWQDHREKMKSSGLKRKFGTLDDLELHTIRASPGPSLDGWARNSDDDHDDRMDGGGGRGGGGSGRGRSSDSFSGPPSATHDEYPSYSPGPDTGSWGRHSTATMAPIEVSLPPAPSERPRLPVVVQQRTGPDSLRRGSSHSRQIGIRVRVKKDGKPSDGSAQRVESRSASRKASASDLGASTQTRSGYPSTSSSVAASPDYRPEHSSVPPLALSRSRDTSMYSMPPRNSLDGTTNSMAYLSGETQHQGVQPKLYQEYSHTMLPLSSQSTGDLPPTSATYAENTDAFPYNSYGFTDSAVVRQNTGDSSMGRNPSDMHSGDISPAFTPGMHTPANPGGYFMPPHGSQVYLGPPAFNPTTVSTGSGGYSDDFQYADPALQSSPEGGPSGWPPGGPRAAAPMTTSTEWHSAVPSSWHQS